MEAINLSNINVLEDNLIKRKTKDEETLCINEINQVIDCIDTSKTKEEICKFVSTERCQNIYNNPATYIPSCEKFNKPEANILISRIKSTKIVSNILCDESCELGKEMNRDTSTQKSRIEKKIIKKNH